MFSQWRHAVENLTQHSPKPSQDGSPNPNDPASAPRASIDSTKGTSTTPPPLSSSTSSSSQLADTALSSLRKTLATQRPASPGIQRSNSTDSTTTATSTSPHPSRSRTTLEDRLRAKLAATAAAASNSASSQAATGTGTGKHPASATSVQVTEHPLSPVPPPSESEKPAESKEKDDESTVNANMLSPKSTPLPDSPEVAASEGATVPLSAITAQPLSPAVVEDSVTTDAVLETKGGESIEVVGGEEEGSAGEVDEKEVERVDVKGEGEAEATEAKDESVDAPPAEEKEDAVEESVKDEVPASPTPDEQVAPQTPSPDPSTEVSKEGKAAQVVEEPSPVSEPLTNEKEVVPPAEDVAVAQPSDTTTTEAEPSATSESQDTPATEEAVPEPPTVHEDTAHVTLPNGHVNAPTAKGDEVDIEALQKRLKLVEQRFAGAYSALLQESMVMLILIGGCRCLDVLQATASREGRS